MIPPRASLPEGVTNYVTPRGLRLLREEYAALEAERQRPETDSGDDLERRRRRVIATRRLSDLSGRIASAEVVEPARQARDKIRFGARVTLESEGGERAGEERRLQIVGVDEADPDHGLVAFVAPLARALLGHTEGEIATLKTAQGEERLRVLTIEYPESV